MNLQSCKFSTTENPVICANAFDVLRSNSSCIPQDQIDVLTATPPYEEISYQVLVCRLLILYRPTVLQLFFSRNCLIP
jgi:hypothetical protein